MFLKNLIVTKALGTRITKDDVAKKLEVFNILIEYWLSKKVSI